jgi:hypothetical protein
MYRGTETNPFATRMNRNIRRQYTYMKTVNTIFGPGPTIIIQVRYFRGSIPSILSGSHHPDSTPMSLFIVESGHIRKANEISPLSLGISTRLMRFTSSKLCQQYKVQTPIQYPRKEFTTTTPTNCHQLN